MGQKKPCVIMSLVGPYAQLRTGPNNILYVETTDPNLQANQDGTSITVTPTNPNSTIEVRFNSGTQSTPTQPQQTQKQTTETNNRNNTETETQGSDVLEQPNQNKVYVVPEQPSTMPQAALGSSNNTNQTFGTAENHGPISTNRLPQPSQNMMLGGPKEERRDGDKVTGPNSQLNNSRLDNVDEQDSMQEQVEPSSSDQQDSVQLSNNTTRQDRPLDQNLQPTSQGLFERFSQEKSEHLLCEQKDEIYINRIFGGRRKRSSYIYKIPVDLLKNFSASDLEACDLSNSPLLQAVAIEN
ncbi:hypothetical protein [Cardinium endosymbiont of Oedothorax gibbosus]|uniref:hypothetical protein n=1 Tax=Cardinium endosymbiont of Oedothorax gibbosus TaxID=931101 RepID=UPI0020248D36|nr:hypothetical protein [Cardinium endosymbiont of Oedothorax gibbosus]CAH2559898.1 hypothetical protein CAOEGIBSW744_0448 [Cardinium endosymbiont of Oedothorax gibbosus]